MRRVRSVLFIDDEWGTPDHPDVIGKFRGVAADSELNVVFRYSTAAESAGSYSVKQALHAIEATPDLAAVVLDLAFGPDDQLGLAILAAARQRWPGLSLIMLTATDSDENLEPLEEAMGVGATDYICKKWPSKVASEILAAHLLPGRSERRPVIWGTADSLREARRRVVRAAYSGANILVTGESGTGKELVARAIHNLGPRRLGPFVAANAGAKDSALIEDDMFGHVKGAFTGATTARKGWFESANGGVLFLDEISAIPVYLQVRLLRVLESRKFSRGGETHETETDFQLVCASNQPLGQLVREGKLREDFFFRIQEIEIPLPPLRERLEDIPLLAQTFLDEFNETTKMGSRNYRFDSSAIKQLQSHPWHGNVRQLRKVVRQACIFSRSPIITDRDIAFDNTAGPSPGPESAAHRSFPALPADPKEWPRFRQRSMLQLLVEARRRCRSNAEFVNRMFPEARNDDLRRALNHIFKAPYGACSTEEFEELASLRSELESFL
jgi:two-component system response regulator HydG